jgi:hypothetical protein
MNTYSIIIDTDQYAGNFERKLCAYCTGQLGECGIGEEYSQMYNLEENENLFDNVLELVPDEYGCFRPVTICSSPSSLSTSVMIYFNEVPSEEMIKIIKDRTYKFINLKEIKEEKIKILGFRLCITSTIEEFIII